jgi:hypothetical protein
MSDFKFVSEIYPLKFWQTLDESIKNQPPRTAGLVTLHPSEASATVLDKEGNPVVLGACLRKVWFRNKLQREERDAEFKTQQELLIQKDEFTAGDLWKFKISSLAEDVITNESKRANIYAENSRKFRWSIPFTDGTPDVLISGEVDLVVFTDSVSNHKVGVEIKSISGYKAEKTVFGYRARGGVVHAPEPKEDNLLQAVLYQYYFNVIQNEEMTYFKLAYISRVNGARMEFDIDLVPELDPTKGKVRHRVYVNRRPYKYDLYAEDIINSYVRVNRLIHRDLIPPRNYDFNYSIDKIKELHAAGLLNKDSTAKAEKGKYHLIKVGDWQCSYCPFQDMCYERDSARTPIPYPDGKVLQKITTVEISEEEDSSE